MTNRSCLRRSGRPMIHGVGIGKRRTNYRSLPPQCTAFKVGGYFVCRRSPVADLLRHQKQAGVSGVTSSVTNLHESPTPFTEPGLSGSDAKISMSTDGVTPKHSLRGLLGLSLQCHPFNVESPDHRDDRVWKARKPTPLRTL